MPTDQEVIDWAKRYHVEGTLEEQRERYVAQQKAEDDEDN